MTLSALIVALALVLQAPAADSLATAFRKDITAILDAAAEPRILLTEESHGVKSTRMVKAGDPYRDGWVIQAIMPRTATLKRGEETVSVDLTRWFVERQTPQNAPLIAAIAEVSLTNASKDRPVALPEPDLADLKRRAEAGDGRAMAALESRRDPGFAAMRERMIAEGKVNAVLSLDGYDPIGPDVIPIDLDTHRPDELWTTAGYLVGGSSATGYALYRTEALLRAAGGLRP